MTPRQMSSEINATLKTVARAMQDASRDALQDAGKLAKTQIETMGRGPTGGDLRFRNMARYNHGGRLAVRLRNERRIDAVTVVPRGPWKLAETGAAGHTIPQTRVMPIGGGMFRRGPFSHPGTSQGTRAWTRGRDSALGQIESKYLARVERDVTAAFGG